MIKPLSRGVAEKRLKSVPYAGTTRIRFKGLISARKGHPYIQLSLTINLSSKNRYFFFDVFEVVPVLVFVVALLFDFPVVLCFTAGLLVLPLVEVTAFLFDFELL